jgi:hypothetical protein
MERSIPHESVRPGGKVSPAAASRVSSDGQLEEGMMDESPHARRPWIRTRSGIALLVFLATVGFFLVTEHTAHVFGFLPYLLLLACPLMQFWHGGHRQGHDRHGRPPANGISR